MAQSDVKGAGLSVGASRYHDRALAPCPAAAAGAREVAEALDPRLVRGVRVLQNPTTGDMLFGELQKAAREARGGAFFFYFAGHALRRGNDLLLAVEESEFEGTKGCVPLSDVLDILGRAPVARGLVILNIDLPPGPMTKGVDFGEEITVIGSSRGYDVKSADARFKEYADALIQALQKPAVEMESYADDGRLDGAGLGRYLAQKAPGAVKAEVFVTAAEALVLRELGADLAAEKAAAEEAAAEKAAKQKADVERAAEEKAAEEKAAEEKAAEEKATRDADEAPAEAEKPAEAAATEEQAAPDAEEAPPVKRKRRAAKESRELVAKEPAAPAKEPGSGSLGYIVVIVLLLAVIAYLLATR